MPEDYTSAVRGVTKDINAKGREPYRKAVVPGAPAHVNKLSDSKGFNISSFALAYVTGDWDAAADEINLAQRFTREAVQKGFKQSAAGSMLLPIDFAALPQELRDTDVGREFRDAMNATAADAFANSDAISWERAKFQKATGTLSAYQGGIGGDLVAPPAFGPIIDIYRNEAVLLKAGAESVPLPPQGSIKYPVQTDVTTATWQGESMPGVESIIGTGSVSMTAKKLTILSRMSNEFMQFSQQLGNQILQSDIAKTMALKVDHAGLYGTGGTTQPLGILRYTGRNKYKGAGAATDGNTFAFEDAAAMASVVEARNFEMKAWVMHPYLRRVIQTLRADAVTAADAKGMPLFDLLRQYGATGPKELQGAPVHVSNQVNRNRVKGSSGATLTTLFGGDFSQVMVGMYGALEITANIYETTAFAANETLFRGICYADVAVKREAGLVTYDHLIAGNDTGLIDTTPTL